MTYSPEGVGMSRRRRTRRPGGGLLAAAAWFCWYALDARSARAARRWLYRCARAAGDADPWARGDARRIARRSVHRAMGRTFGSWAFGRGWLSRILKSLLGV